MREKKNFFSNDIYKYIHNYNRLHGLSHYQLFRPLRRICWSYQWQAILLPFFLWLKIENLFLEVILKFISVNLLFYHLNYKCLLFLLVLIFYFIYFLYSVILFRNPSSAKAYVWDCIWYNVTAIISVSEYLLTTFSGGIVILKG